MQIGKYLKPEALLFTAFLATLPLYAPNQILFETDTLLAASVMPPFANTMLGTAAVLGAAVAWFAARRGDGALLSRPVTTLAAAAYAAGYVLLALCAAVPGFAGAAVAALSGFLLAAATVVLAVAWGACLSSFGLRPALLWVAVMVGAAALVELLLSSVSFGVGIIVFAFLVLLAAGGPCWLAWRGEAAGASGAARNGAAGAVAHPASEGRSLAGQLRAMASVVAMPFAGLMVFAFIMGARKFILFDEIHMEVLGCALGALIVVPICLIRTERPLMPLIYRLLVPLFCLGLIVLNAFPGGTPPLWLAGWLTYMFYGAVAILALAGLTAVAHASEFPVGLIVGVTAAGFSACSLLGVFAAWLPPFQVEGGGPALLVVSTLYFAYLLGSALLAPWRPAKGEGLIGESGAVPEAAHAPDVAARCETLADEAGLTPREREIFAYVGRGHGIAYVAETLVISESTVRTHLKSIYKKLGVNSREELLAKVDA